jgi:DNA-binding NtrC family response regulator
MVSDSAKTKEVSVLVSGADWAWPKALHDIFEPRGVRLLLAKGSDELVNVLQQTRIHTTIVDMDCERPSGLAVIKLIRMDYPLLPCILLTSEATERMLSSALHLDIFGVVDKPVDMGILQGLLNRLFIKKYNSRIFA